MINMSHYRNKKSAVPADMMAVLGMHRSGTSAVMGMIQEQGVYLHKINEKNRFNPKGNRENQKIIDLHNEVLKFNHASWRNPPEKKINFTQDHVNQRNEILQAYDQSPCAFKDPRLLILMDFWKDIKLRFIGVVRNPISVIRSLQTRSGRISDEHGLMLWKIYNKKLLEQRKNKEFPIINFDNKVTLEEQVINALKFYGIESTMEFTFYDPRIVQNDFHEWENEIDDKEALRIWNSLNDSDIHRKRWFFRKK